MLIVANSLTAKIIPCPTARPRHLQYGSAPPPPPGLAPTVQIRPCIFTLELPKLSRSPALFFYTRARSGAPYFNLAAAHTIYQNLGYGPAFSRSSSPSSLGAQHNFFTLELDPEPPILTLPRHIQYTKIFPASPRLRLQRCRLQQIVNGCYIYAREKKKIHTVVKSHECRLYMFVSRKKGGKS